MTCVDVNESSMDLCRKRIPAAKCILTTPDAKRIPCDSGSASLLLCIEVAPVIQSDWFIPESHRVLQHGGLLLGVIWNRLSFRGVFCHMKAALLREDDYYGITYGSWKESLCQRGFRIVREEGLCWFPFSRTSNSRLVPYATRLESFLGLRKLPAVSPWVIFIARKE